DDARILASHDLLIQRVPLGPAGDLDEERGQPVEGGEQLVLDRARSDDAGPADDCRSAVAAFPGFAFLASEGRDAAIGASYRLGAIVRGEHDNGVVGLSHVVDLLEHVADVVVHLLHAGFLDAPILAANLAEHGQVLVRQHGRDVHTRRVVPDEERLAGAARVVAVEEVDDLGGDFLVHRLRALQGERSFVTASLVLLRAVRGFAPDDRAWWGNAIRRFRVHSARDVGQTGDGR